MIFLGIVGAESPMAKVVLKQLQEHKEEYRVCFTVDPSYKENVREARFNDVDGALLSLTVTLVIDFTLDANLAYFNAKIYHSYHVPAIFTAAEMDEDALDNLQHIRSCRTMAPMLIIEPSLSVNQIMLIEQIAHMLGFISSDVVKVEMEVSVPLRHSFDPIPYMPIIERINKALGTKGWESNGKTVQSSFEYKQKFGYVHLTMRRDGGSDMSFMNGLHDVKVAIHLLDSKIELEEKSGSADIWRGLSMIAEYVAENKVVTGGEIITNLLPTLINRYLE